MEFLASLAIKALVGTSICGAVTVGTIYKCDKTLLGFKDNAQNPTQVSDQKQGGGISSGDSSASVGNPGSTDGEKSEADKDVVANQTNSVQVVDPKNDGDSGTQTTIDSAGTNSGTDGTKSTSENIPIAGTETQETQPPAVQPIQSGVTSEASQGTVLDIPVLTN